MTDRDIEYFYSVHSAFAYLGSIRLREIAEAAGVRIIHRPINLGLVVRAAYPDGVTKRSDANKNYFFGREIERWAEHRDVPMGPGIPNNHRNDVTLANCVLVGGVAEGLEVGRLAHVLMKAHWVSHADLSDEAVLAEQIRFVGLDADVLLASAREAKTKAAYEANSAEAIERSVFGSPTYFVGGDMFYGQDHLELVERALRQPYVKSWKKF